MLLCNWSYVESKNVPFQSVCLNKWWLVYVPPLYHFTILLCFSVLKVFLFFSLHSNILIYKNTVLFAQSLHFCQMEKSLWILDGMWCLLILKNIKDLKAKLHKRFLVWETPGLSFIFWTESCFASMLKLWPSVCTELISSHYRFFDFKQNPSYTACLSLETRYGKYLNGSYTFYSS